MSKEYILISENNDMGTIALNRSVFESIVENSEHEVEGVYTLNTSQFSNTVVVKVVDNKLNIVVNIHLKYGTNVLQVCQNLQHRISENVLNSTGITPSKIDINVLTFAI